LAWITLKKFNDEDFD
jgi:hypothetical protein